MLKIFGITGLEKKYWLEIEEKREEVENLNLVRMHFRRFGQQ